MMGDNRDNSTDSRVLSQVGYVPFENIVGRRRSSSSRSTKASAPGRCGAGRGRCAGAGCSRSCDEPQAKAQHRREFVASVQRVPLAADPAAPAVDAARRSMRRRHSAAKKTHAPPAQTPPASRSASATLQGRRAARARADAYFRAGRAAQPRQQLSAARIPRRPCARPRHLRHAVSRLSEGRRGRAVAPARRPGAQGGLRRRGARDRSRRGDPARRVGEPTPAGATAPRSWPTSARRWSARCSRRRLRGGVRG